LDDEQRRVDRLVGWGLAGAAQLCLHTHSIIGASGIANADFILPHYTSGNFGSISFAKPGLYNYSTAWQVMLKNFGAVIERLADTKDIKKYLTNVKHELWSEGRP